MSTPAPDTGEATTTEDTADAPELGPYGRVLDKEGAEEWKALKAENEKWKAQARKHEDRAKSNASAAAELEALRLQSMTDQEKAVATARTEAKAEALREVGSKLVVAEFRAALAGRGVDVEALMEGVDPSRFVATDGDPDRDLITKWVDRIAPAEEEKPGGFPDLGQGVRTPAAAALNSDPLLKDLKAKLGVR